MNTSHPSSRKISRPTPHKTPRTPSRKALPASPHKTTSKPLAFLRKTLWFMVYLLPAALFFSYHPVISFGSDSSMNFELSIPLIWLVLFDLLSFIYLIAMWRHMRSREPAPPEATSRLLRGPHFPGLTDRRFFLFSLFPFYATISIFWSANLLRGFLTAGIIWLIFFAVFSLIFLLPISGSPRRLRFHVLAVMFVATVLVCKYCYAQSIMDVLGLSRDTTLLCPGCTYHSFGFPHPSGFAIEPQFMGNLLLAPTLTALYLVSFRSRRFGRNMAAEADYLENKVEHNLLHDRIKLPELPWKKWQYVGMVILTGFLSMTLFFTFSRGAIYAYAVTIIVLLIYDALKRHQFRWSLLAIPVVSFLLSLGLQGTFAAVGPTAETFVSGVTKSIHQLSLGIIDLRGLAKENKNPAPDTSDLNASVENSNKTVEEIAEIVDNAVEKHEENSLLATERTLEDTIFEGYVPESTNIRLSLNSTAIKTWYHGVTTQKPQRIGFDCRKGEVDFFGDGCRHYITLPNTASVLFGVGLGGAGTAMHKVFPEEVTSPKEIVQNEPISLLLETGLIGIALVILTLLIAFWPQLFSRKFLDGHAAPLENPSETTPKASKNALCAPSTPKPSSHTAHALKPSRTASYELDGFAPRPFWRHPVIPLLAALIVAYLVTLNFFSGLPNALQIYLMPPLLYLIFSETLPEVSTPHRPKSPKTAASPQSSKQ